MSSKLDVQYEKGKTAFHTKPGEEKYTLSYMRERETEEV